jgi:hypothetical protein
LQAAVSEEEILSTSDHFTSILASSKTNLYNPSSSSSNEDICSVKEVERSPEKSSVTLSDSHFVEYGFTREEFFARLENLRKLAAKNDDGDPAVIYFSVAIKNENQVNKFPILEPHARQFQRQVCSQISCRLLIKFHPRIYKFKI